MEIDRNIANLISIMEWDFTDSIWDNFTKQWIRYPVKMMSSKTKKIDEYRGFIPCTNQEEVDSMFYKFGYNELQIGEALSNILKFLENRYDLNINELEENYQKKYLKDH